MRSRLPFPVEKIDGHVSPETGTSVRVTRINGHRITFGDLARMAWPTKTESNLAHFAGCDPRTCRRWLAGTNEPPAEALGIVLAEIMKRYHQRG